MRALTVVLACLLLVMPGQSYAQSGAKIFSTITTNQLSSVLAKANRNPKINQGTIQYDLKEFDGKAYAYTIGEQGCDAAGCAAFRLVIVVGKSVLPNAKPATINEFNGKWPFAKAYLDNKGNVRLNLDVHVQGGVTEKNIIGNVELFEVWIGVLLEALG
jgi:hypothetical protein